MVFANKTTRCPRWWHLAVSRMCHCWAPTTLQSWDHNDIYHDWCREKCVFFVNLYGKKTTNKWLLHIIHTIQLSSSTLPFQDKTTHFIGKNAVPQSSRGFARACCRIRSTPLSLSLKVSHSSTNSSFSTTQLALCQWCHQLKSLTWSPAAMASCCSGCTSTGKVCPRRTC